MLVGSIAFDHSTAKALISALETADERVHRQSMEWSDAVDTAMDDFQGAYARLFSSNATSEKLDRSGVCFHLLNVARQVQYAQDDARAEVERLAAVADWEQRYAVWQTNAESDPVWWTPFTDLEYGGLILSRPSQTPTKRPTIQADVTVRGRDRVSSGSDDAVSSASTSNLRSFVAIAERCNGIVEQELEALRTAWSSFRSNCSWVIIETFTLLDALERYLEHGRLEARWINQIADAFEVAGTGELTNELLNALAPALHTPSMTDKQLLRTLVASDKDLAQLMKNSPALANQLQLISAEEIHTWWHRLAETHSTRQQDTLWEALPEIFGNLEGIPYNVRDQANKLVLKRKLHALETELATLTTQQHDALREARSRRDVQNAAITSPSHAEWTHLMTQVQAYREIQAALESDLGQPDRQLISLTADEPPLAAVSMGNLDEASNITYTVAGMTSSTTSMTDWTDATADVHQVVSEGSDEVATVAWLGYEAPPAPPASWGVFGNEMAQRGGDNLDRALQGLDAVRGNDDPQINVVAHSYGTTTTAFALSQTKVEVDNVIFVGSAGLPDHIEHASDLNADNVYAGHAQDVYPFIENGQGDQWAWIGRDFSSGHRVNPMSEGFGATTFGTDTEVDGVGAPTTTHGVQESKNGGGYFDADTESLDNIGYILRNETDKLSEHIYQGLTMFQQSLIPGGHADYYR